MQESGQDYGESDLLVRVNDLLGARQAQEPTKLASTVRSVAGAAAGGATGGGPQAGKSTVGERERDVAM